MSVAEYNFKGFIWCEDCKQYELIDECTSASTGICVNCCCNKPIKTGGNQDWEGRAI